MTVDEQQRFDMHIGLRQALGDDVAATVMEHLPPSGWSDVARTRDIEHLQDRIDDRFARIDDRFARVDDRFARIDDRFGQVERRLDSIVRGLWTIGTVFAGAFVGLFSLIATKF